MGTKTEVPDPVSGAPAPNGSDRNGQATKVADATTASLRRRLEEATERMRHLTSAVFTLRVYIEQMRADLDRKAPPGDGMSRPAFSIGGPDGVDFELPPVCLDEVAFVDELAILRRRLARREADRLDREIMNESNVPENRHAYEIAPPEIMDAVDELASLRQRLAEKEAEADRLDRAITNALCVCGTGSAVEAIRKHLIHAYVDAEASEGSCDA